MKSLIICIDGQALLTCHAGAINEGFENNNSELRWHKGELWVFTLWTLAEGDELYGAYALPYWREKGDKETLAKAEKYYAECEEVMKNKPLGAKAEDEWERGERKG